MSALEKYALGLAALGIGGSSAAAAASATAAASSAATATNAAAALPSYVAGFNIVSNIFDAGAITSGTALRTDGTVETGLGATYYTTGYMPCSAGQTLYASGKTDIKDNAIYGWHWYDVNKTKIGQSVGTAPGVGVTVPSNAFYARTSFGVANEPAATLTIYNTTRRTVTPDTLAQHEASRPAPANLVNPDRVTSNTVLKFDGTTGAATGYYITDYMAVAPGQSISANSRTDANNASLYGWVFYDIEKRFVSGIAGSTVANTAVTVPAGCYYARVSFNGAVIAAAVVGISIATTTPNQGLVSAKVLTSYLDDCILNHPDNLVDKSRLVSGRGIKSDGTVINGIGANFAASDYIAVIPGGSLKSNTTTDISGDGVYGWHFYDINKGLLSAVAGTKANVAVTVPAGAFYARASINVTTALGPAWRIWNPTQTRGRLAGKVWFPIGDSITAKMTGVYQSWVCDLLGLTIKYQDARGGRRTDQIFEMYQVSGSPVAKGDPVNGLGTGGIINTTLPQAAGDGSVASGAEQINQGGVYAPADASSYSWAPAGNTLASDLSGVDFSTIFLGMNDNSLATASLGSLSSTSADGTYYGWLRWAIEGILTAVPSTRLMWIIPYQAPLIGYATSAVRDAIAAVCESYGVPYVDMYRRGGINMFTRNAGLLLGDFIHPTQLGGRELIGRMLMGEMERTF